MKTTSTRLFVATALLTSISFTTNAQLNNILRNVMQNSGQEITNAITPNKGKKNTYTYEGHTYTMRGTLNMKSYHANATGEVTFTHVPSNYEEFKNVYENFLGQTPHGTAAMMTMAMEIYGRNREEGLQCIQLICYPSNVNSVVSILKEKMPLPEAGADSYHQRYLPAAVLKGATPQNGYTPTHPYTINMKASANKHQDMQLYDGRVMYIYVMGKGWDTEQRTVEIVQTSTDSYCKVFNCPSLYTQCKNIRGTWPGLK